MEINTTTQDDVSVISVAGSIDSTTAPQAQEQVAALVAPRCCLVLDLSACTYISSAGLRVLLMLAKQLSAKGGHWAFAGLSDEIKDVMDMTGFSGFFAAFATVAEAAAAVKKACD